MRVGLWLLVAVAGACPAVRLAWLPEHSQVNRSSDPTNKYGLEDGVVVRRQDGGLSMVAAEMYRDPRWVSMRLGVYRSPDGLTWHKQRTLRQSEAGTDGQSPHDATWGPFLLWDPDAESWGLSYVGYRCAPSNGSGWLTNYHGQIYFRPSGLRGDLGLDCDFGEAEARSANSSVFGADRVLIGPDDFNPAGPWPHRCQGLQGTDSFFPYQLADGSWAGLAGTSMQQAGWRPGPPGSGTDLGKWPVSLATAPRIGGPWTRHNPSGGEPADAPCLDLNGGNTENPIVSRRPDNRSAFQAVFDYLGREGQGFGYACSEDGLTWAKAAIVDLAGGCRTPFGLVPMTDREKAAHRPDVLAYGVLNVSEIDAPNSALQWLFYTVNHGGWESFRAAVVQLRY